MLETGAIPAPNMTATSFYNRRTTTSSQAHLIGDDRTLKDNFNDLTREDLRERLYVAECVMKSLFERNKQLEDSNDEKDKMGSTMQPTIKDAEPDKKIALLEKRVKELEKETEARDGEKVTQTYKEFMSARLEESQSEAKRHFENYVQIREKHNTFIESRLAQYKPAAAGNGK